MRRFRCRYNGELVFGAELYPGDRRQPYLAFSTLAADSGTLSFTWEGDNGFAQTRDARDHGHMRRCGACCSRLRWPLAARRRRPQAATRAAPASTS